jgi:sigma-E factor negative regulatory protein RseA
MEKISQLMDGELSARESRSQIQRLEHDRGLSEGWETYHLIRDALRNEVELGPQFSRRLHERIEQEPAIVAPHTRLPARMVRYTLPMAAGIAGIAVVGWLALSGTAPTDPGPRTLAQQAAAPAAGAPVDGEVRDYMLAHQEFSPSTAMQGVVSYVRTVSEDAPGQ